jgi:hypothetical protein
MRNPKPCVLNMISSHIQENVTEVCNNINPETFIYDLLMVYGISKTSVTRLKKGDLNLSMVKGEVLCKKKVFLQEESADLLLRAIDSISKNDGVLSHSPRFAILTDHKMLLNKDLRLGKMVGLYKLCSMLKIQHFPN